MTQPSDPHDQPGFEEDPEFTEEVRDFEPAVEIPPDPALDKEHRIPKTIHLWIMLALGLIAGFGLLIQGLLVSPSAPSKPIPSAHEASIESPPPLAPLEHALDPTPKPTAFAHPEDTAADLLKKVPGQLPRSPASTPEDMRHYEIERSESLIAGSKILALNHGASTSFPDTVGNVVHSLTKALPVLSEGASALRQSLSPAAPQKPEPRIPALRPTPHTPGPLLLEGSTLPCVLLSEIRSDLPGMIVAQVSEDIFDSNEGTSKLIPRGAKLIGRYDTRISQGQQRLMASFHRLILPNGQSVLLDKMDGADLGGGTGLAGDVDTHFWARFGEAFLIAGIAKVGEPSNGTSSSAGVSPFIGPNAAGQVLVETARLNLQANGAIQPTITVHRGEAFLVMVNRDLSLPEFKDAP